MSAPDNRAPVRARPVRAVPGEGVRRRHVLVILVRNRPGVLNRVASLMRARNFNIESLTVNHTDDPDLSRMTVVLDGDDVTADQAVKQLYRLIDVLKVRDLADVAHLEREVALIKLHPRGAGARDALLSTAAAEGAKVADQSATALVLEVTGTPARVDEFIELVRPFGLRELVRTGTLVIARGSSLES